MKDSINNNNELEKNNSGKLNRFSRRPLEISPKSMYHSWTLTEWHSRTTILNFSPFHSTPLNLMRLNWTTATPTTMTTSIHIKVGKICKVPSSCRQRLQAVWWCWQWWCSSSIRSSSYRIFGVCVGLLGCWYVAIAAFAVVSGAHYLSGVQLAGWMMAMAFLAFQFWPTATTQNFKCCVSHSHHQQHRRRSRPRTTILYIVVAFGVVVGAAPWLPYL